MESSELIKDKYYHIEAKNCRHKWIIKWGGQYINYTGQAFYKPIDGPDYFNSTDMDIREATEEEEGWLKACIKAKKFVGRKKAILPAYEIY